MSHIILKQCFLVGNAMGFFQLFIAEVTGKSFILCLRLINCHKIMELIAQRPQAIKSWKGYFGSLL
jgi:hypothetical protein